MIRQPKKVLQKTWYFNLLITLKRWISGKQQGSHSSVTQEPKSVHFYSTWNSYNSDSKMYWQSMHPCMQNNNSKPGHQNPIIMSWRTTNMLYIESNDTDQSDHSHIPYIHFTCHVLSPVVPCDTRLTDSCKDTLSPLGCTHTYCIYISMHLQTLCKTHTHTQQLKIPSN